MPNGVSSGSTPAGVTRVRESVGTAIARPSSPAEQELLDWLESNLALESQLDYHGTANWKHRSLYELLAAYGRWFIPAVLPTDVRALLERHCFVNAHATEREHSELAYVEGFALGGGSPLPTLHAWCTNGDGHVIDPTWSKLGGSAYLGIALPSALRPRGPHHRGVLEAPDSLYPLLRSGL